VVFGTYVVIDNFVKIDPIIYDVNEHLFQRQSYSRGTLDGLESLVDAVADDLYDNFVEISPKLQGKSKKIAIVSDFETVSGKYDRVAEIRTQAEALTNRVIMELDYLAIDNTQIMSTRELSEYDDLTPAELITKVRPDMYMTLIFVFDGTKLTGLKTDFNILEKSREQIQKRDFELPFLPVSYYPDFDFTDFVINELTSFFETIIDDNGQWDISAFPNKTATKPENLEKSIYKAENFNTRNIYYLSNYYYYDALNRFPDQIDPVEIRLQIGFNKIYLDRLEEADQEFDYVLQTDAKNAYAYLGKSVINFFDADYENALKLLNTSRDNGLDNPFVYEVLRGYYNFEMQKYKEALEAFESALQKDPGKLKIRIVNYFSIANIKVHIGLCYIELERYKDAIDYDRALVKEFPYNKEIPYYLGDAYSKKGINEYFAGNYNQAIRDFQDARKSYVNPSNNDYLRTAYIYEDRYAEAEKFIREEIEAGNYDEYFIWQLHGMDLRSKFLESYELSGGEAPDTLTGNEAIRIYGINAEVNPSDAMNDYYIGELMILMKEKARGLEHMEKAFALDEVNFDIQTGLLHACLINNRLDDFDKWERSLGRINRKYTVPDRTIALNSYLTISAEYVRDKKAKRELRDLENLLDNGVIIDNWYYEPYLDWLENCPCPDDVKKELGRLTERMRENKLN
jgi:tetratricopeptide (TPR) repeat protein